MADPDPQAEQAQTVFVLARVYRAHVVEALAQGRLAGLLGALRALEHLSALGGFSEAAEAFRAACEEAATPPVPATSGARQATKAG
jgi:hypothetical protein